jgi:PhoPQ-activated pathogenicity-related protein
MIVRGVWGPPARAWLVALVVALGLAGGPARADLFSYVKKPEPAFAWKLKGQRETLGAKVYDLELTSQVWQTITWKHDLMVVVPAKVKPTATLFLWNQGGVPSLRSLAMALDLATKMQAPACFLYGIPNQPLLGGLKEDALIAETFVRYLDTRDEDWPLLFPMVKSLVKAMDALQAFSRQEWKTEVKSFVVAGASKRGWTAWLTAVADPRVKAVVPMVIDTLNMQKQLPHQLESYGAFSDMIRDYTKRKLAPPPKTPEGLKLWRMVDPWAYRDRLKLPKLILNGTNDPYWTQDALNLYWDDLPGDKWLCYVPNAGHNLAQKTADGKFDLSRARGTLPAFARAYIHDKPLPRLTWKHAEVDGKYRVSVTSDVAPKVARLWQADAPTRDFRKAIWKDQPAKLDKGNVSALAEAPASGCRVFFVECEYELDGLRCFFSTQLRIVGKPEKKKE